MKKIINTINYYLSRNDTYINMIQFNNCPKYLVKKFLEINEFPIPEFCFQGTDIDGIMLPDYIHMVGNKCDVNRFLTLNKNIQHLGNTNISDLSILNYNLHSISVNIRDINIAVSLFNVLKNNLMITKLSVIVLEINNEMIQSMRDLFTNNIMIVDFRIGMFDYSNYNVITDLLNHGNVLERIIFRGSISYDPKTIIEHLELCKSLKQVRICNNEHFANNRKEYYDFLRRNRNIEVFRFVGTDDKELNNFMKHQYKCKFRTLKHIVSIIVFGLMFNQVKNED